MVKKFSEYEKINESNNEFSQDFVNAMGDDNFQAILTFEDSVFNLIQLVNDQLLNQGYNFDSNEIDTYMKKTLYEYLEGKALSNIPDSPIEPSGRFENLHSSSYSKLKNEYLLNKNIDKFNI